MVKRSVLALAAALAMLVATPAGAQPGPAPADQSPDARKAYNDAFAAMMRDPANLDVTFAYAEAAVKVGDYEGAIGALERMLFLRPNLPQVKLELGVLYYRMGSYAVARGYVEQAMAAPDVPPAVRTRGETFLAELDQRLSRSLWTGSLYAGIRYQSNANAGPGGIVRGAPLGFPIDFVLNDRFRGQEDWNTFVIGTLRHRYDLGTEDRTTWESSASIYWARQFEQHQVDIGYVEVTTGPRFVLPQGGMAAAPTIRAYAIGDYLAVGNMPYYYIAPGGGVSLAMRPTPPFTVEITSEARDRIYRNSSERPFNAQQSGLEGFLRADVRYAITENWSLLGGIGVMRTWADRGWWSSNEFDATLGTQLAYVVLPQMPAWRSTLAATRALTPYDEPDPSIDPGDTRTDRDWRIAFTTEVPIDRSWSVIGTAGYIKRSSNIPNYAYDNAYVSLGAAWHF